MSQRLLNTVNFFWSQKHIFQISNFQYLLDHLGFTSGDLSHRLNFTLHFVHLPTCAKVEPYTSKEVITGEFLIVPYSQF